MTGAMTTTDPGPCANVSRFARVPGVGLWYLQVWVPTLRDVWGEVTDYPEGQHKRAILFNLDWVRQEIEDGGVMRGLSLVVGPAAFKLLKVHPPTGRATRVTRGLATLLRFAPDRPRPIPDWCQRDANEAFPGYLRRVLAEARDWDGHGG